MENTRQPTASKDLLPAQNQLGRVAITAWEAGLCPLPTRQDGTKAPLGDWRQYQAERPTLQQIKNWFGSNSGIGLVCGQISGNLECLEFDDPAVYASYKYLAGEADLGALVELVEAAYLEQSPSGGIHWLYRCSQISGNTKLARRPVSDGLLKVLIETRGEGGYIIIAPSHGTVHPSGKSYLLLRGGVSSIATITPEERRSLWGLARTFDVMPKAKVAEGTRLSSLIGSTRPGDELNSHTTWEDILAPHGWVQVCQRDSIGYWRRPGKESGVSATTNWQGSDLLYVFSTSTVFEPERGYSKFSAYSVLEHHGDFKAAAKSLAIMGYGSPLRSSRDGNHRPRPITGWEVQV